MLWLLARESRVSLRGWARDVALVGSGAQCMCPVEIAGPYLRGHGQAHGLTSLFLVEASPEGDKYAGLQSIDILYLALFTAT